MNKQYIKQNERMKKSLDGENRMYEWIRKGNHIRGEENRGNQTRGKAVFKKESKSNQIEM